MLTLSIYKHLRNISRIQLVVLCITIVATVGVVKYFGKKEEWRTIKVQVVGRNWTNTFTNYEGYRPPYWLAEHIKVNDAERGINGATTAYVTRVETYSRGSADYDVYLTLSVNGIQNMKTGSFSYSGKNIEVGAPLELRIAGAQLVTQIIDDDVPAQGYANKKISAVVRIRNSEPWIIDHIKIGDTMSSGPEGDAVATITNIQTEPAQSSILFTDTTARAPYRASTGSVIIEQNSRLRDLVITATLTVEKHNGEWFFGGHQNIKSGNLIWLYLPKINIKGAEIESANDITPNEE